ncbi:unnamed protein product [Alternaria burnsii]|nr:unnamed protein product [Alternaria burnsii]
MTDPYKTTNSKPSAWIKKSTTPLVNVDSVSTTTTSSTTLKPPSPLPERPSSATSWRSKLHIHGSSSHSSSRRSKSAETGKERWRDANLSEKERWKDWQKAKDKEQMRGSTVGAFTQFYKGTEGVAYWIAL